MFFSSLEYTAGCLYGFCDEAEKAYVISKELRVDTLICYIFLTFCILGMSQTVLLWWHDMEHDMERHKLEALYQQLCNKCDQVEGY